MSPPRRPHYSAPRRDPPPVADLSNDVRPVAVSLAHVAARQELRNLMLALGLDGGQLDAPLDAAA